MWTTRLLPCRPCWRASSGIAYRAKEDRIVIDPAVCNGRTTVRGTRITAQTVLEFLGAGDSIEDVLDEYVSIEAARERYGVILTGSIENVDLAVDTDKTTDLRRQRLAAKTWDHAR